LSFPLVSWRAFRVWQRNRDVFLRLWKAELIPYAVEPLIILSALGLGLGFFIGEVEGQSYLEFLTPGIVAAYCMFSATFECTYGSYVRMELQRTYDAIIATPVNIEDVIAGEILWAATRSLMTAIAIGLVGLAFGVVPSPLALWVLPLAVLIGTMFGSIAMFFTSIAPSIASFNYFFTLFVTPLYFFGGVFFPLSSLPEAIQRVASFVPLTSAVDLVRALYRGQLYLGLVWDLIFILMVMATFFTLSLVTMRRRLIK
jgi:lipooligosaccharide transport system permease protein